MDSFRYVLSHITTHDHDLVSFSETWFNSIDDNDSYISTVLYYLIDMI